MGVITTSYPRHAGDFAGNFVRDRVRALVRDGHAVEVIAAGERPTAFEESPEPGVTVLRLPFGVAKAAPLFYGQGAPEVLERGDAAAWFQAARFSAQLAQALHLRARRFTAVESHWLLPCGLIAAAICRGRPHRIHAHSGDVALLERLPAGAHLARNLWSSGARFVFVSDDLRSRFARLCGATHRVDGDRALVEAMPIDSVTFTPPSRAERLRLRQRLGLTRPTVLAVGRLVPIKGFDILLRAVGCLPIANRPDVVILGEGDCRPGLQALARRRAVTLQLPGVVDRDAVAAFMRAADVYAQPCRVLSTGRTEGMPLAAREALAAGLPTVVSATGGLAQLARRDPRVTAVPPENVAALAGALSTALRNPLHSGVGQCALKPRNGQRTVGAEPAKYVY